MSRHCYANTARRKGKEAYPDGPQPASPVAPLLITPYISAASCWLPEANSRPSYPGSAPGCASYCVWPPSAAVSSSLSEGFAVTFSQQLKNVRAHGHIELSRREAAAANQLLERTASPPLSSNTVGRPKSSRV
jgi:hypothetical protein